MQNSWIVAKTGSGRVLCVFRWYLRTTWNVRAGERADFRRAKGCAHMSGVQPHTSPTAVSTLQIRSSSGCARPILQTDMTPGYGSMSKTPMVCAWYEVYVENVSLDEQASATPKCAHLDDAQSPQPPLRCKHATSVGCYAADARPAWAGCGRCPPKCASAAFVPQPYTERGERRLGPCHTHVDCLRIAGLGRVLSATVAHNPHRCKQASAQAQHYRVVARKPRLSTAVTTSLR